MKPNRPAAAPTRRGGWSARFSTYQQQRENIGARRQFRRRAVFVGGVRMPGTSRSPACETESVLSNGNVELLQQWRPGGAQGNSHQLFDSGEQYLFAIRLADDSWDFCTVRAYCDSETPAEFTNSDGEPWGSWDWFDVEWFVPCAELDLPFITQPPAAAIGSAGTEGEQ